MPLPPSRIAQIAVRAHDVERAAKFYTDVLGLPLLMKFPNLAFVGCGETRLMLSAAEGGGGEHDHAASILYYAVADIEAVYAEMKGKGADFIDEPHVVHRADTYDLWIAALRDTEGNTLAITEEKGK